MGMDAIVASEKFLSDFLKLELLHIMNQPTRRKVLEVLLKHDEPLYIKEIADIIDATERNTSFHLARLAKKQVVEGEFKPIESEGGRAGKFYKLNPKKRRMVKRIIEI